jgi:prefoldin subunit 5
MSLSWLYERIREIEREIQRRRNQIQQYRQKISQIEKIYDKMQSAKRSLIAQKNDLSSFSHETFSNWKGQLYKTEFVNPVQQWLVSNSYPQVIRQVDANMDALNDAKTDYENRILDNFGIIGDLAARINSLENEIENMLN